MRQIKRKDSIRQIEKNIMFVSTIYDSFEALEETLSKLKLNKATNLVRLAKISFAEEVFKYAKENNIYVADKAEYEKKSTLLN